MGGGTKYKDRLSFFSCWVVFLSFRPGSVRLGDRLCEVNKAVHSQDLRVREGWSSDCAQGPLTAQDREMVPLLFISTE